MNHQAQVQELGLFVGVLLVGTDGPQEVLRDGQALDGAVQIEALIIEIVLTRRIGMGDDDGEAGDQLGALANHVLQRGVVGVGVRGVEGQHRAAQLVHDVPGGVLENQVLGEIVGQSHVVIEEVLEHVQFLGVGQAAQQQQKRRFFKTEAVFLAVALHQLRNFVAGIGEVAFHGNPLAVENGVTEDVAHFGVADHDAGAVGIAQTALDIHIIPHHSGQGFRGVAVDPGEEAAHILTIFFRICSIDIHVLHPP